MLKLLLIFSIAILLPTTTTKASEIPDLNDAEVFFFQQKEVEVPIIMYHLITERPKYIGKHGITPTELEKDLIYLKENDYNTIIMQDLIDFVERGKKLPKKPIILTFDDGNFSDYSYLLPLLQKYEMKAVLAIIGEATDRYTKVIDKNPKVKISNMAWQHIQELHNSGHCEIQSHGYNVHGRGGSGKKRSESMEAYHSRLSADLIKLQNACEAHLGWQPNTFVYPLGIVSEGSRQVLENLGIVASLGCEEGINIVRQGDKDCLFKMHRYNRPTGRNVENILTHMKKTVGYSQ